MSCIRIALAAALVLGPALSALAQDTGTLDKEKAARSATKPAYSPYVGRNFPTRPLFGDSHLHTSFSFDAGAGGGGLTPKED